VKRGDSMPHSCIPRGGGQAGVTGLAKSAGPRQESQAVLGNAKVLEYLLYVVAETFHLVTSMSAPVSN